MKKLTDILKNTPVREVCGDTAAAIGGLVYDSRAVKPGDCFFAVPGTQSDGHDYIPIAVEKGAAAIVCERMPADAAEGVAYVLVGDSAGAMADMAAAFYDYPSRELKLVGITGTNGKTTTATLLYDLVRAMGYGTIAGLAQDLPMPFRDVTTNVGYIAMAHELGLVNGTAATTFSPDQTATREQAAVMLIRLYDSYHAAAPEKTGIAYSAEGLTDLTGYGAVAVGGARLIYAGESRLAGTPDAETAAALQETITAAGAVPLLHVGGSASALKDDPSHTAEVLAAAVESGGYEGLFLDLAELSSAQKKDFTALAEALRAELGEDRLLYLMVEAPVWQGAAYNGYDYAALSEPADKLVVRVADYGDVSEDFPIAPLAPLEEVYYALAELADQVDSDCLSLLLTTTGSAWTDGRHTGQASAAEIEQLLSASQTKDYYSDRYACAYLTSGSGDTAVWYLNGEAALERARMAAFFGVDQLCLSDLSSVADYENYDLLGSLTAEP